jgi:hypothetical protein
MDDENGTIGDGPVEIPPPSAGRTRPAGSPGHKCRKVGCECFVHDSVTGSRLCQPNCPGSSATAVCCDNGTCGSAAFLEVVAIVDE